ncbi:MAG: acylphosphatase [Gemmatimonadaceae bacterium]
MNAVHWRVEGKVQGVGFRWFVRETARRLDLAGWVANRPDGTVELAASGPDEVLERLRAAVREGPPGARVTGLVPLDAPPRDGLVRPFTILR